MEELFDGYVCTAEYCLLDSDRPCCDCSYCVSVEDLEEVTK